MNAINHLKNIYDCKNEKCNWSIEINNLDDDRDYIDLNYIFDNLKNIIIVTYNDNDDTEIISFNTTIKIKQLYISLNVYDDFNSNMTHSHSLERNKTDIQYTINIKIEFTKNLNKFYYSRKLNEIMNSNESSESEY